MKNKSTEFSGKQIVIGMFVFAITVITALWTYTYFRTAPFRPLNQALAERFEDSHPKVEWGQRKIHKKTPTLLRVVMKVEFDPTTENDRAEKFADEVIAFARQHHDINQYDTLEIHLYKLDPEKEIKQWKTERKIKVTTETKSK